MIALLGWGSLVWNPKNLAVRPHWDVDGPWVRAEFLRQSNNGRLTLVLSESAEPVRSLWTTFSRDDLADAREELRRREGIPQRNFDLHVGSWSRGSPPPASILDLEKWTAEREIDAVVWTALPPKFSGEDGCSPSVDQATSYLAGLTTPVRELAEEYIRRAPQQIDTPSHRGGSGMVLFGWLGAGTT
jgi:hypothetical protein